jgi:hypothetical protein
MEIILKNPGKILVFMRKWMETVTGALPATFFKILPN